MGGESESVAFLCVLNHRSVLVKGALRRAAFSTPFQLCFQRGDNTGGGGRQAGGDPLRGEALGMPLTVLN